MVCRILGFHIHMALGSGMVINSGNIVSRELDFSLWIKGD